MTKRTLAVTLCALALASVTPVLPANAADVRVNVNTRGSSIFFDSEPEVIVIPNSRVYYYRAPEYDVYRYNRMWYVNRGGVWYRASTYQGPFVRINAAPRSVIVVPSQYRRWEVKHDNGKHRGWRK